MAGIKISALPSVGAPALTDIMPEVQPAIGGVTYKVSFTQLLALFQSNIQITESQVTNLVNDLDGKVSVAGDTMTGFLILNADPILPLGAVTKQYADSIASGLIILLAVYAASTTNLTAVYSNGVAGVGATLVNSGGLAAFSIDGVNPPLNARILVKDQTTDFENGIYTLTTVGSGAIAWVLTRATDYDTPAEINPGDLASVNNGTVNAATGWLQTATVTTIGVDPILWSKFGGVVLPLAVSQGGTGSTTAAGARTNLGAAASGANADITSMAGITGSIRYANTANTHFFGLRANAAATGPDIDFTLPQTDGTAGQALVTNGAGILSFGGNSTSAITQVSTQRIPATGAFSYVPTVGTTYAIFELQGGGGGSGGSTGAGSQSACSGGGGGGAYVKFLVSGSANLASIIGSVGVAGAAGTSGNNAGGAGGNTTLTINGGTVWTAGGGGGGGGSAASAAAAVSGTAGTGGSVTLGTNATVMFNSPGGNAADGFTVASGGTIGRSSNLGGNSILSVASSLAGGSGFPNGGGAPARQNATGVNQPGGAGGVGIVLITEYGSV